MRQEPGFRPIAMDPTQRLFRMPTATLHTSHRHTRVLPRHLQRHSGTSGPVQGLQAGKIADTIIRSLCQEAWLGGLWGNEPFVQKQPLVAAVTLTLNGANDGRLVKAVPSPNKPHDQRAESCAHSKWQIHPWSGARRA